MELLNLKNENGFSWPYEWSGNLADGRKVRFHGEGGIINVYLEEKEIYCDDTCAPEERYSYLSEERCRGIWAEIMDPYYRINIPELIDQTPLSPEVRLDAEALINTVRRFLRGDESALEYMKYRADDLEKAIATPAEIPA